MTRYFTPSRLHALAILLVLNFCQIAFPQSLSQAIKQGMDPDEFLDHIGQRKILSSRFYSNPPLRGGTGSSGFGATGTLTTPLGSSDAAGRAGVVQSDGRIVVAGRAGAKVNSFVIARYNPDGSLDSTFGTGGSLLTSFGSGADNIAYALSLQTDGKYIVSGKSDYLGLSVSHGYYNFATLRLNTNGSLDTSFNTTGRVTTNLTTGQEFSRASAIQSDGKILVGGYYTDKSANAFRFSLIRYNIDGSLDTTFLTSGQLTTQITTSDNAVLALTLQTDGKIVSTGTAHTATRWDMAIARYNTDGSLDTSFNSAGTLTTTVGTSNDAAYAVQINSQAEIIVGGSSNNGANADYAVVRYNTDGSLDTSFNSTGKLTTAIGTTDDVVNSLGLNTDGKIWAGGYSNNGTYNKFSLLRYNTDGSLDTSFNTNGKLTSAINTANDEAQAVIIANGYAILAGRTNDGTNFDFGVARYNTDASVAVSGGMDLSFGTSGQVVTTVGTFSGTDAALAMAIQTNGTILVGGYYKGPDGQQNFALLRYLQSGSLDTSFNTGGTVFGPVFGTSAERIYALATQSGGKILAGGASRLPSSADSIAISRYNSDGSLDTSFFTSGGLASTIIPGGGNGPGAILNNILVQTDGKLAFGVQDNNASGTIVGRFNTDGSLDTSFFTSGLGPSSLNGVGMGALQTDGKLLETMQPGGLGVTYFQLIRFNTNGSLDTSFFTNGKSIYTSFGTGDTPQMLSIQSDGKLVTVGFTHVGAYEVELERWNTNGTFDTSFNTAGGVYTSLPTTGYGYALYLTGDNKILVAGNYGGYSNAASALLILRYNSDGTLDSSFHTAGYTTIKPGGTGNQFAAEAITQEQNGQIIVAGYCNYNFCVVSYSP